MINAKDIQTAHAKIKGYITKTPLVYSQELSKVLEANVYLKMEQFQITGSFKLRGMMHKILGLEKQSFDRPLVAASTGNHASAFGYAAEKFGFSGTLFLPKNVNPEKAKLLKKYGQLTIYFEGNNSLETETIAAVYARKHKRVLIHPYNDTEIIKGQGTVALEIEGQLPNTDLVLVPVGGGGLAAGTASYFMDKENVAVIGCQPKNASEMYSSIKEGKIVPPSTLTSIADAAAGGIEKNAVTYPICKNGLTDFKVVDENSIEEAMALLFHHHKIIVEPTAALPLAALLQTSRYRHKNVVLVLTGKTISKTLLTKIINRYALNTP
jgi:threonine dehydratase